MQICSHNEWTLEADHGIATECGGYTYDPTHQCGFYQEYFGTTAAFGVAGTTGQVLMSEHITATFDGTTVLPPTLSAKCRNQYIFYYVSILLWDLRSDF